ncbi:hypothetical protein EVG20_g11148, partial [Dentipellis fragilis]
PQTAIFTLSYAIMSQPNKRPRSETASSTGSRTSMRLLHRLLAKQDMADNPNGDASILEDVGGTGVEDEEDHGSAFREAIENLSGQTTRPLPPPVDHPDLLKNTQVTGFPASINQQKPSYADIRRTPTSDPITGVRERCIENGFWLPGDGPKPQFERVDFRAQPKGDLEKLYPRGIKGIRSILQNIVAEYAPRNLQNGSDQQLKLITPHSFYHQLFRSHLQAYANRQANGVDNNKTMNPKFLYNYDIDDQEDSSNAGKTKGWDMRGLFALLESNDQSAVFVKQQLHQAFFELVLQKDSATSNHTKQHKSISHAPEHLVEDVKFAQTVGEEISLHRYLGQIAYESALWIPCHKISKSELTRLDKNFIIESEEIFDLAVKNKAVDKDHAIVPDKSWTRIVKPPPSAGVISMIFYNADNVKNGKVKEEDIFGACIHNAQEFTAIASEISQEAVQIEAEAVVAFIQAREALRRSFSAKGSMVKSGTGLHATGGILHSVNVPVDKIKSARPRDSAKLRIANQTALRIKVQKNKDILQAFNYAILEGFMPHWAQEQMIKDDESNFFYADFKLILQVATNTHWMWHAAETYHGTTLGRLCAKNPSSWKSFAKKNADLGQWSRANVITHSQVTSAASQFTSMNDLDY